MHILGNVHSSQIIINIHQLETTQSSIRFVRGADTLLAIDLDTTYGRIYLNCYIGGEPLRAPPEIKIKVENIVCLNIDYNEQGNILSVDIQSKNGVSHKKVIRIKDFMYEQIIGMGIRATVLDGQVEQNTIQEKITQFAMHCVELPEFQNVTNDLEKGSPNKLSEAFVKAKHFQTISRETEIHDMKENTTTQLHYNKSKKVVPRSEITMGDTGPVPIYLYQQHTDDPKSGFILQPDGTLTSSDWSGSWYCGGNYLFLFTGTYKKRQHIQLLFCEGCLRDSNGYVWLMSLDNNKTGANKDITSPLEVLQYRRNKSKIVVLVISCVKRQNLVNQARSTWVRDLQEIGVTCYFVIGNPRQDIATTEGDLLIVPCPDNYESLPSKVYLAMKYCLHNCNFSHVFKVDDDTIVNPLSLISLQFRDQDYIGRSQTVDNKFNRFWHRGKCEVPHLNQIAYPANRIRYGLQYAKGEAGYFLSRRAIKSLIPMEKYIMTDLYEDKAIGECLGRVNIKLCILPEFTSKLYENFPPGKKIDEWTVIVDVPLHQNNLYQTNMSKRVLFLN